MSSGPRTWRGCSRSGYRMALTRDAGDGHRERMALDADQRGVIDE